MSIIVCPLDAVGEVMHRRSPARVVSLLSPGAEPPVLALPADRRLCLAFNDITEPRDGLTPPEPDHIATLLAFLHPRPAGELLLIHCWAGVSRSTAAGYIAACQDLGSGGEAELARRLRSAAPFATPNPRMIALADDLLRRDGAMVRAIVAIGRGREDAPPCAFDLQ